MWLKLTDYEGNPILVNMDKIVLASPMTDPNYPDRRTVLDHDLTSVDTGIVVQEPLEHLHKALEEF